MVLNKMDHDVFIFVITSIIQYDHPNTASK